MYLYRLVLLHQPAEEAELAVKARLHEHERHLHVARRFVHLVVKLPGRVLEAVYSAEGGLAPHLRPGRALARTAHDAGARTAAGHDAVDTRRTHALSASAADAAARAACRQRKGSRDWEHDQQT